MTPTQFEQLRLQVSRRSFLTRSSRSLGALALASLLDPGLFGGTARGAAAPAASVPLDRWAGAINPLHLAPKAKRVIYLYMAGGPSHLETLDYKPKLAEMSGK